MSTNPETLRAAPWLDPNYSQMSMGPFSQRGFNESWQAYAQRMNAEMVNNNKLNREIQFDIDSKKIALQNQSKLSDLFSSVGAGSANPFGSVPTMDNSNRFESGLGDAESRLRNLLDNPDSINQSAAYKFRVGQGQEALQRSLGAKGLLNSGNRLMELTKYGQDMGSQEYDNQFGRLGSLLGNYSQSWLGDKNANTSRFAATSGAWNTAQGNADRNRLGFANLAWDMNKPQSGEGGGGRVSSGGMNPIQQGTLLGLGQTPWQQSSSPVDMSPQPGTMAYNDWVSAKNTRQTY
jgi:hypothetical protein